MGSDGGRIMLPELYPEYCNIIFYLKTNNYEKSICSAICGFVAVCLGELLQSDKRGLPFYS